MFELQLSFTDVVRTASALGASADQIPYVVARSLNDAVEEARSFLISSTWPTHVNARNRSFLKAALTTKDARATKGNLTAELYDKLDRGSLLLHAKGGTKSAKGGNLAIGGSNVKRTSRGVSAGQRPRGLKNSFKKGDVIYQRQMGGKGRKKKATGKLKLMYVLKPKATIKKDVPMYADFEKVVRRVLLYSMARNVKIAMSTRR